MSPDQLTQHLGEPSGKSTRHQVDHQYVVVITGGSMGIGAHLYRAYHALGATTINLDITAPTFECEHYYAVDLADAEQVRDAFAQIEAQFGAVHVLINNGAMANFNKPIAELTCAEFNRVIDVNLKGTFACCEAFIRLNRGESYGRIVNMASTRWGQNEAGWDAYGASKGGVVSLTQSLAVSLTDTPITVNAISPGWIQVENYDDLALSDHQQHPSGRVGKPQDIVNAALFLTHPDNGFINGHNLVVDGGMSKKMIYLDSLS